MIVEYEGESYEFEMADVTIKQGIKIEKFLGCPYTEFGERLSPSGGGAPDLAALQCLGWLILGGGSGPVEDTDFKVASFFRAVGAAFAAGQPVSGSGEPGEADPTAAAATSLNGAPVNGAPITSVP